MSAVNAIRTTEAPVAPSVTLADIRAAAERIRGAILRTPTIENPAVNRIAGTRVFLKHPAVRHWEPTLLGLHRYQFIELAPPATR